MLYPVELQTRREFSIWEEGTSPTANLKSIWGGRRDSNPQQPEPQSGALPLSYDHHNLSETESKIPILLCKQRARLFPSAPLIVSGGGPETSPQPVWDGATASHCATRGGLARRLFLRRHHARPDATG